MSRHWVTGGPVHTVTLQLTQRAVETGRAGVFTQMSVVSRSTLTGAHHSVTSAVIVTVTFQLAVGTKPARRTLSVAVRTSPAQTTGTVAGYRVTHSSITAATALGTVRPKPAWRAAVSAVLSPAPREAHAPTGDRVTLGSISTQRHPGAVDAVTPSWTCDVTARSNESCWTFTGSGGRNALPSIFTLTVSLAVRTVTTLCTDLVTFGATETWSAVT